MVTIGMNYDVLPGKEELFEEKFRVVIESFSRDSGHRASRLYRDVDSPQSYLIHSDWESRDAFTAWTQSEAFAAGHRQGSLMGVLEGPPEIKLYDGVIVETPAGRTVPAA